MGVTSTWLIVGITFFLFTLMGIIMCYWCCAKGCRRENKGMVLSNSDPEATRELSEENLLNQATLPNYIQEPPQQYPSYYQSGPLQPPYYSPAPPFYQHNPVSQIHTHGVPETPPPPYDAPSYEAPSLRN